MDLKTYGVKYIGSKKDILPYIGDIITSLGAKTAIDVFAGTTRVAQYLKQLGITTYTSDLSWATTCYANTYVHNGDNRHLQYHIEQMNKVEPIHGWLSKNYTGETDDIRSDGRCFQLKNASKADAARDYIDTLEPGWEKYTLITSIIRALDAVDNTVGIQQAYLKEWCSRSFKDIIFQLPENIEGPTAEHFEGDCLKIDYPKADVAYIDPPYSPHSYSTYYHIWDSIARWDKPETSLKAKRRIDRVSAHDSFDAAMSSPWNSKKTALESFSEIVNRLPVKHCVVSYNDESLVSRNDLISALNKFGNVSIVEVDYRRNIMSQIGNSTVNGIPDKNQTNKELIITVTKAQ